MSSRSRQFILAPEARQDLRGILLYTERRWDKRQRSAYKARLDHAMRELARFPNLGRARDDISPGLRGFPVEAHIIFYRVDDQTVRIVRVLHGMMDAAAQLGP
jgi:toxin ParE1/3/4